MSAWNWILLLAVTALLLGMFSAVAYMASGNEPAEAAPVTESPHA